MTSAALRTGISRKPLHKIVPSFSSRDLHFTTAANFVHGKKVNEVFTVEFDERRLDRPLPGISSIPFPVIECVLPDDI